LFYDKHNTRNIHRNCPTGPRILHSNDLFRNRQVHVRPFDTDTAETPEGNIRDILDRTTLLDTSNQLSFDSGYTNHYISNNKK